MSDATDTRTSSVRRPVTERIKTIRIPQKLRNLELGMLIIACLIAATAIGLVQLGALGHLDYEVIALSGAISVLVLALHVILRFVAREADPFILPIVTVLNGLGIAEIYRLDIHSGYTGWSSNAVRQVVWALLAVGVAAVVLIVLRNHRSLFRYTYLFGLATFLLLLLPFVPGLGIVTNGARIGVGIPHVFSFQTGEIAKITLAIFFAGYLVRNRDSLTLVGRKILWWRLPRMRDLGPVLVFWLLSMGVIVFQRDLGTALLYFGMFLAMIYLSTGRWSWVVIGLVLFLGGAYAASRSLSYVQNRFENWLDPFTQKQYDLVGGSGQLVQGLFGMANGGMTGTGLGQGMPWYTPLAQSDYIVASLGEELGLAGVFIILCLYLLFIARGLRIGFAGQDDFGRLLGAGVSFVVALQVFVVIGGLTRVIPLTGLTAPFLASGGSSLLANWIIVALLLRLSDSVRNQPRLVVQQ